MDIFTAQTQEDFIFAAYQFHKKKTFCEWYDFPKKIESVIDWLYKLGRDRNLLDMDYTQFSRVMTDSQKEWYNGVYRKSWRRAYWGSYGHHCDPKHYRVLRGFTYRGQKKKDGMSNREAWRVETKHKKDKQRSARWHRSWKKNLKHYGARKHRRMQREALQSRDLDRMHNITDYKRAEDAWSWD